MNDKNHRQTEERFLTAIAIERQRLLSRRGVLRGAIATAGGAALALGAMPVAGGLRSIFAQDFNDDLEILNYALTLEHLEYAFYRDGLAQFSEDDLSTALAEASDEADAETSSDSDVAEVDDEDDVSVYARLEEVRDHEQAHVDTLAQTITDLGGTPVNEGTYDFGYGDDAMMFLTTAQALENTGVAAYAGAAPQIQDDGLLAAALSIHSVEARHAAYINDELDGAPFPAAFDEALSRDEVLAIAGDFIVSEGTPADAATPDEDAPADEATPGDETPAEETATEAAPTEVPPTQVPPTEVPPTEVPPTEVPPTEIPATEVPPTQVPPTEVPPTEVPATEAPALPTGTVEDELVLPATSTP